MKKMTLVTLFLSLATLWSCSNAEQTSEEELTSITAKALKEEVEEPLYGLQMYYTSTEAEIRRLETLKTNLVAEQEKGNSKVLEQIESIQKQIENLTRFNKYLISLKPPKGLKPLPPPQPCFSDENNCDPEQKISPKTVVLLGNDLNLINVIIKNQENEVIKMEYQPIKDSFGQASIVIKSEFRGAGVMLTTFKTKELGEITIPTPVISE
tara:strand:+ start:46554 stop:47183 length:630 start_codon:yes stop_codon:yes gene_type:complete